MRVIIGNDNRAEGLNFTPDAEGLSGSLGDCGAGSIKNSALHIVKLTEKDIILGNL